MLETLDKMERHPRVHTRRKIGIEYTNSDGHPMASSSPEGDGGEIQSCWCYTYHKYTDEMVDLCYVDVYDAVKNPNHEYTWDTVYIKQGMTREEGWAHLYSKTFKE